MVDDGSRDDTVAVDARPVPTRTGLRCRCRATSAGGAHRRPGRRARRGGGVDGRRRPAPQALLADMLRHWRAGADVVYAVRGTPPTSRPCTRRMVGPSTASSAGAAGCASRATRATSGCWTGAWWTRCWPSERHPLHAGLYAWVGFPSVALDYEPLPRRAGTNHFGLSGALGLGTTGLLAFRRRAAALAGPAGPDPVAGGAGLRRHWVVIEYFWLGSRCAAIPRWRQA